MHVARTVEELIGSTPLVDLSPLAGGTARVLGKLEAANPGGSAKDRVARAMVDDAERTGRLSPGGTIIEPTSGNTGVGLAMVAAARGYRLILTMPDTMSVERRALAAAYGAQIELTPGAEGMAGAVARAEELAAATPGSIIAGQFDNPANPRAHYETTGPEIWADTDGTVDVTFTFDSSALPDGTELVAFDLKDGMVLDPIGSLSCLFLDQVRAEQGEVGDSDVVLDGIDTPIELVVS